MKALNYAQKRVSCAHRYVREDWGREKNLEIYGEDYSEDGMGHNFGILACGRGDIQAPLRQLCETLDHQFLNEVMEAVVPTTESIAKYCFEFMDTSMSHGKYELESVQVHEGDFLWAKYNRQGRASITKVYRVNCLHHHYDLHLLNEKEKALHEEKLQVYGYDYGVEVSLSGVIDKETYLICHRGWMDCWVNELLVKTHDKMLLNEFIDKVSGEAIIQYFYGLLQAEIPIGLKLRLGLRRSKGAMFFIGD